MSAPKINLSEHFYSVQCEGASTGVPAYFIRLAGCNLLCGNPVGGVNGPLKETQGDATWICDSIPVWRRGVVASFDDVIDNWKKESILEWVLEKRVHVIWTGGEPTLPKHQRDIVNCINYVKEQYNKCIYSEIETNGTCYIEDDLFSKLYQINCSVKLNNSGMKRESRIKTDALKRIMMHPNYWFKFVISNEDDIHEITRDFITPLNIPPNKVLMMPGLDSQKNFHERTLFTLLMAKRYGYIGMSRLHISAWDKVTGV